MLRWLQERWGGWYHIGKQWIWALSLTITLGVLALFLGEVYSLYYSTISNAERDARSFADVLAEHTARTFEAARLTLGLVASIRDAASAGHLPTTDAANQALRALQESSPALVAIGWTNAAGDIVARSDYDNALPRNIADWPHFTVQRDGAASGLYISRPFYSQAKRQWLSAVSLPLKNPDGSFAGIVAAMLDQSYFARIYRSVDLGRNGAVILLRRDGWVLTREPFVVGALERQYADTKMKQRLSKAESGTFEVLSPIDAASRLLAYRAVPDLPLVLLVTYDHAEALEPWYGHIRAFGPPVGILVVVILLGTSLLSRRTRELADQTSLLEATLDDMRQSEARYRLLADNSTDMIFRLDLDFVRQYVSPACQEILGYAPEELVGRKPTNMIHPDEVDYVERTYRSVVNGLARTSVTNRIRHRDGRWIWVEAELRLVRDVKTGLPAGILGALRDISARKAIEAEAAAARHQAERAAAAQGEFLATMSHELRTPLHSILGSADLLLARGDLVPDVRRRIGLIQTASDSLLTVVNDVLDYSQIEEGRLDLLLVDFRPCDLIDDSVAIVREFAAAKNLDLRVSTCPDMPSRLRGDDRRLRQVLLNLLNNAIKFTQRGHVAIEVTHEALDDGRERLRFAVADSGMGIPKDKFERLFQRFSQVDGSTSREFGGSGLGLAISKRLVEMMGGEIGVESIYGEGSTFWFTVTLPIIEEGASIVNRTIGIPASAASTRRVLLVEDVAINREIARSMVMEAGYEVDAANDGAEAISALQRRKYDVVLMDIQMPGMDGVTATKAIRALPGTTGRISIIAMTANVLPDQIEAFRAAGMDDHVGKPFKRKDLIAAIERRLRNTRCAELRSGLAGDVSASDRPLVPSATQHSRAKSRVVDVKLDTFRARTGRSSSANLLNLFAADATRYFVLDKSHPNFRETLAKEAHALAGAAGLLGFNHLLDACATLELAAANGGPIDIDLERARLARDEVLEEIRGLLASADQPQATA